MEQGQPPRLRISEPGEAAQIIPYLVGFVPEESLVASIVQNGRVQVTARVDLDDVQRSGVVEDLLDRMLDRYPGASVFAVAYTADHLTGWNILARCDEWLPDGCQSMLIDADRWHTPDGTTGTIDLYGAVAAQATYYGLQRLGSRAELEARFASPPDSDELDREVGQALDGLPQPSQKDEILALTRELIGRNLPPEARASEDGTAQPAPAIGVQDAIRLAVLVQHPAARDLALLSIDSENSSRHLQLWQSVVSASPAHGADMPLYLAGMAAWVSGDGASATIAIDRAVQSQAEPDPTHPIRLIEGLIDQVVSPSMWEPLRDTIMFTADEAVQQELAGAVDAPAATVGWPPARREARQGHERAQRKPPSPRIAI